MFGPCLCLPLDFSSWKAVCWAFRADTNVSRYFWASPVEGGSCCCSLLLIWGWNLYWTKLNELGAPVPVQLPVLMPSLYFSPQKWIYSLYHSCYNGFSSFFKERSLGWCRIICKCPVALQETKFSAWTPSCCTSCVCRQESGEAGAEGCSAARDVCWDGSETSRLPFVSKLCWIPDVRLTAGIQHKTKRCFAGMTRHADLLCSEISPVWNEVVPWRGLLNYNERGTRGRCSH